MPEIVDSAFVEILPELSTFQRELERGIDAAMQRLERTADEALHSIERSFDETAQEASGSLADIDADFSEVVDGAEVAGDEVGEAFDDVSDDVNDALSDIDADFSSVVDGADSAADDLAGTFDDAAAEIVSAVDDAASQVSDAFDGVGGEISGELDEASASADDLESSIKKAVAAVAGFAALRSAALDAEAFNSEMRIMESQLDDVGQAAGFSITQLEELARASAIRLGVDVTDMIRAQRTILLFTDVTGDAFVQTTELAADMATFLGRDVPSAAQFLGRALTDPVRGLSRLERQVGFFDAATKEAVQSMVDMGDTAGAQQVILDELSNRFGGVAEAAADTSARLSVTGAELRRQLGTPIIAAVDESGDAIIEILESLAPALENIGLVVGQTITIVAELSPAIAGVADIIGSLPPEVFAATGALLALNRILGIISRHPVVAAATGIALAIGAIKNSAEDAAPTVNELELAIDNLTRGVVDETTAQIVELGRSVRDAGEISDDFGSRLIRGIKDPLNALSGPFGEGKSQADIFSEALGDLAEESVTLDQQLASMARAGGVDAVNAALETLSREMGITGAEFDEVAAQVLPDTVAALQLVDRELESTGIATEAVGDALERLQGLSSPTARSFIELAAAIRDSDASAEDAKVAAETLGVPMEDLLAIAPLVAGAFEALAASVESSMPRISDAVDAAMSAAEEDQREFTMSDFEEELEKAVENAANFNTNVKALLDAGFTDLAALAAERGPEFAAAAADSLGDPEILNRVEGLMGDLDAELDRGLEIAARTAVAQAGPVGEAVFDGVREGVEQIDPFVSEFMGRDFPAAIKGGLVPAAREGQGVGRATSQAVATGLNDRAHAPRSAMSRVLREAIAAGRDTAGDGAFRIGTGLMSGIASGIRQASAEAQAAMTREVDRVVRAGRLAGGIASPSRRTAREIGGPLAEGIGLGIGEDSTALEAMRALIDEVSQTRLPTDRLGLLASGRVTSTVPGLLAGAAERRGGSGVEIGTMNIYSDDARRAGHAVVTEITDQVYLNAGRMTR